MAGYLSVSRNTLKDRLAMHGGYECSNGIVQRCQKCQKVIFDTLTPQLSQGVKMQEKCQYLHFDKFEGFKEGVKMQDACQHLHFDT